MVSPEAGRTSPIEHFANVEGSKPSVAFEVRPALLRRSRQMFPLCSADGSIPADIIFATPDFCELHRRDAITTSVSLT